MPPIEPAGNGSNSLASSKSPLLSKYYQNPGRAASIPADTSTSESLSLPFANGSLASQSNGLDSQRAPRPESPPNMSFSSSPPPPSAALPRINAYNPQQHGDEQGRQDRTGSVPVDTTQWGVKYMQNQLLNQLRDQGHFYNNSTVGSGGSGSGSGNNGGGGGQSSQQPPRSSSLANTQPTSPPTNLKQPPLRKVSADGYTLQAVAYSPKPPLTGVKSDDRKSWDQQSQASWEPGDDGSSASVPPPKPPKISDTSASPPRLPAPPRLPLLFFEQNEKIDQMDFAYQRPQYESSKPDSQAEDAAKVRDEPSPEREEALLPPPLPPPPPSIPLSQPATVPATMARPSSKPIPPPIDTFQNKGRGEREGVKEYTEQEQAQNEQEGNESSDRSFFWDPPSSNSASPKPSEDEKDNDEDIKTAKPKANEETQALTSATALGFGGPSDWEHFGDYDAEEIDDIALYTSSKPKTAELPASSTPVEEDSPAKSKSDSESEPNTESEPEHELELHPESDPESDRQPEQGPPLLGAHGRDITAQRGPILSVIEEGFSDRDEDEMTAHLGSPPISPRAVDARKASISGTLSDHSSNEEQRSSKRESKGSMLQFESPPSGARNNSFNIDSVVAGPKPLAESPPSIEQKEQEDVAEETDSQAPSSPRSLDRPSGDEASLGSKKSAEQIFIQTEVARPAIVINEIPRKALPRTDTEDTKDDGEKTFGFTSPISDDGKEDIIISLQVPESPSRIGEPANDQSSFGRDGETGQRSPDLLRQGRMSVFPAAEELEEPYAGLDPWAKASLNRYIKMLREEAQAQTDEEKYMTFINFTHKETKNRLVFYDLDDDSDLSDRPISRIPSKRKPPQSNPQQSSNQQQPLQAPAQQGAQNQQPINIEPKSESSFQQQQQQQHQQLQSTLQPSPQPAQQPTETPIQPQAGPSPPRGPGHKRLDSKALPPPPKPVPVPQILQTGPSPVDEMNNGPRAIFSGPSNPAIKGNKIFGPGGKPEESFVMVDSPKSEQAPGPDKKSSSLLRGTPSLNALRKTLEFVTKKSSSTTAQTAAASSQPNKMPAPTEIIVGTSSPGPLAAALDNEPRSGSPDKPQYKAYNQGGEPKPYEGDKAENRKTIYRPFSTMLRQSSVRSGRSDGGTIRSFTRDENTASIVEEVQPRRRTGEKSVGDGETKGKLNYRYTILEPLLNVIPHGSVLHEEPQAITQLRQGMESIPDDFTFIHKTVLSWDAEAKKVREQKEKERHERQEKMEHRIDELFHAQEIGYGDIPRLESEGKQQENNRKAEEEREEVQTFVEHVFNAVWTRINYEIHQLTPYYEECKSLVNASSAGKEMFGEQPNQVPIAPAMEILLMLYHKLNVRYQKAFEAVLERDRRLKKTEIDRYYRAGRVEQLKQIKDRYEDAEKKAILDFCKERDERANSLMDVLDQNTLRGVGANQDYMESVMQAIRRISMDIALGESSGKSSVLGEDEMVAADDVLKAKTITTALARSSEQIVQNFHVADMLLNAADYEVSVANAKLQNADTNAFRKLREAKSKEDNKLAMDLEHRMKLIRRDTNRTQDEIAKLLMLIQRIDGGGEEGNKRGPQLPLTTTTPASPPAIAGGSGMAPILASGSAPAGEGPDITNEAAQKKLIDDEKEERLKKALEGARNRNQVAGVI